MKACRRSFLTLKVRVWSGPSICVFGRSSFAGSVTLKYSYAARYVTYIFSLSRDSVKDLEFTIFAQSHVSIRRHDGNEVDLIALTHFYGFAHDTIACIPVFPRK